MNFIYISKEIIKCWECFTDLLCWLCCRVRGGRGGLRSDRGRGRGQGRGRGRGRRQPVEKSADELDKELENYHADAMQT